MNIITLIGRVGREPEVKSFPSGGQIVTFSLATSERYKDKSGEKVEKTQWHSITVRADGLQKVVENYVNKGDMLAVSGQLEYRQWEKDGVKMTSAEIVVGMGGKIELLGGGKEKDARAESQQAVKRSFADDLDDSEIPF